MDDGCVRVEMGTTLYRPKNDAILFVSQIFLSRIVAASTKGPTNIEMAPITITQMMLT